MAWPFAWLVVCVFADVFVSSCVCLIVCVWLLCAWRACVFAFSFPVGSLVRLFSDVLVGPLSVCLFGSCCVCV